MLEWEHTMLLEQGRQRQPVQGARRHSRRRRRSFFQSMFMMEAEGRVEQKMVDLNTVVEVATTMKEMTAYLCVNWQAPRDRPAPQTSFPPVGSIFLSTKESMTE